MHEVHRPPLVDADRHCQTQQFLTYETMARLDSQVQLELAVNLVDAFVVPFEAFDVAQIQETQPEAPVALVIRQPYQPIGNHIVFGIKLGLVSVAGLADAECLTDQLDRG